DEQGDQSPAGGPPEERDQRAGAAEDLERTADVDQLEVPRQVRRHDLQVEVGPDEVEGPGADEEQGEGDAGHGPEPWPLHALAPPSRGSPAGLVGRSRRPYTG